MKERGQARRRWGALALIATLVGMGACGGGAAVGDTCETPGSTDECEDGAICDSDSDLGTTCLVLCERDEDCPAGDTCQGTSGSLKGCHPK